MRKSLVYLGVAVGAVLIMLGSVTYLAWPKASASRCAVTISKPHGKQECVQFEWVTTEAARTKGLSGRTSLAESRGMAFGFATSGPYCLWMKDMNFAIDMVWLSPEQRIIKIARKVSPQTYPTTFCPSKNAKYILELSSGVADKAHLRVGQKLNLDATN